MNARQGQPMFLSCEQRTAGAHAIEQTRAINSDCAPESGSYCLVMKMRVNLSISCTRCSKEGFRIPHENCGEELQPKQAMQASEACLLHASASLLISLTADTERIHTFRQPDG